MDEHDDYERREAREKRQDDFAWSDSMRLMEKREREAERLRSLDTRSPEQRERDEQEARDNARERSNPANWD